jgi:prefoldin subunit 5
LAAKKPHVICEVLASSQLKLLIAERKIYQSEIGSIDVSIKALNSAIALLQKCENKEKEINQLGKKK